jgi:uncharacterized UBP type Zn finger protein
MSCDHLADAPDTAPQVPFSAGCQDCVAAGEHNWVHLRVCLDCGHVGCCDSSPRRHASAHYRAEEHPTMRSYEQGERWRWCFVDETIG